MQLQCLHLPTCVKPPRVQVPDLWSVLSLLCSCSTVNWARANSDRSEAFSVSRCTWCHKSGRWQVPHLAQSSASVFEVKLEVCNLILQVPYDASGLPTSVSTAGSPAEHMLPLGHGDLVLQCSNRLQLHSYAREIGCTVAPSTHSIVSFSNPCSKREPS